MIDSLFNSNKKHQKFNELDKQSNAMFSKRGYS